MPLAVGIKIPQMIPVEDPRRVEVLDPAKDLVDEELAVLLRELLVRLQDHCQVALHQLGVDVDVLEVATGLRELDHITTYDLEGLLSSEQDSRLSRALLGGYILMITESHDLELPQCPCGGSNKN